MKYTYFVAYRGKRNETSTIHGNCEFFLNEKITFKDIQWLEGEIKHDNKLESCSVRSWQLLDDGGTE